MDVHAKGGNLHIHEHLHSHTWGKPTIHMRSYSCIHTVLPIFPTCRERSLLWQVLCTIRVCVRVSECVHMCVCVWTCAYVILYCLLWDFVPTDECPCRLQDFCPLMYPCSKISRYMIYRYEYTYTYIHIYSHKLICMPTCMRISLSYHIKGANSGLGFEASKFFLQVNCFWIFLIGLKFVLPVMVYFKLQSLYLLNWFQIIFLFLQEHAASKSSIISMLSKAGTPYIGVRIDLYIYIYTHTYAYIYIYMYIYMYVCIHMYICRYMDRYS